MSRLSISPFLRVRGILAAFALAIAALVAAQPAMAATPTEQFVTQNVQRGLTILNNHSISDTQRRAQFRDFLTGLTDIRRIALFTLGSARRTAAPADVDAFVNAFREYAVAVYESRLTQYAGQFLRVTGSSDVGPGDTVVACTDGITEAMDKDDEEFGSPRLAELVARENHLSAGAIVDSVLKEVDLFSRGGTHEDDRVILVMKVI